MWLSEPAIMRSLSAIRWVEILVPISILPNVSFHSDAEDRLPPKSTINPINVSYFPRKRKASFFEFIFVLSTKKNCPFLN
jgi:hypothetical protein